MNKYLPLLKSFRILFATIFLLLVIVLLFFIITLQRSTTTSTSTSSQTTLKVSRAVDTGNQIKKQEPFHILKTNPALGENNVYPGEITITITTDKPIVSEKSFSLSITPELAPPANWKVINGYPTNTIKMQIFGGLQTNTQYTIKMLNNAKELVYDWNFQTSSETPENNTGLVRQLEEETTNKYFPLIKYVPYSTPTFSLDYVDGLTVEVDMKGPDEQKIKKDVEEWIRNRGVDPATHTIKYIRK